MGFKRLGFKFRMKLAAQKVWVIGKLNHFHEISLRTNPGNYKTGALQFLKIGVVELISVAVAFRNFLLAISLMGVSTLFDYAWIRPKSHRRPFSRNRLLLLHDIYDGMGRLLVELGRVCARDPADVAGKFHHRELHPK